MKKLVLFLLAATNAVGIFADAQVEEVLTRIEEVAAELVELENKTSLSQEELRKKEDLELEIEALWETLVPLHILESFTA